MVVLGVSNGVTMSMGEGEERFSTVFHQRKQNRSMREPLETPSRLGACLKAFEDGYQHG